MYQTVLVTLDGSPLAERAVPFAVTLARASGGRLVLARAAAARTSAGLDTRDERLAAAEAEATAYLRELAQRVAGREAGLADRMETDVPRALEVSVAAALLESAREWVADVIVMATHGRSGLGRWLYGSVADDVLRHAAVPVLLVPVAGAGEAVWAPDTAHRVLVPLDGSALAEEAVPPALELAAALGADLHLLRVIEPPTAAYAEGYASTAFDTTGALDEARAYLDGVAAPLRARGLTVEVGVEADVGLAQTAIAAAAHERHATAISMATHGRGGLARLVLGSVATGTLQRANVPLLLVRPMAMR
jgi:nucleotide-binding universal stress UspA family protein